MTLAHWDPFAEMSNLSRTLDRWMESRFGPMSRFSKEADIESIPVDVYDKDNEVIVKASLPGVKPEDMELNVLGDSVSIKAQTSNEEEVKEENYFRRERHIGYYHRIISLPPNLKVDDADATFENGVLTLRIPKREEARPKQINIRSGAHAGQTGQGVERSERAA